MVAIGGTGRQIAFAGPWIRCRKSSARLCPLGRGVVAGEPFFVRVAMMLQESAIRKLVEQLRIGLKPTWCRLKPPGCW